MSDAGANYARGDQDTQLMLDFQAGDGAAFALLVERYQKAMINLAYRLLRNSKTAEDVAQDVFLKVYQARERYQPTAKFKTWLYRIATNHCINVSQKEKRRQHLSLDREGPGGQTFGQGMADAASVNPESAALAEERAILVRKALEELPERHRTAVVLSKWEDLSYEDIGEVLDLSVPATKSLLYRARMMLKEQLENYVKSSETHSSDSG